ncbi:JAB domain-containing protein [Vibrio sp. M260118]|uniref:JAB domain-containing protein n=1 Tax=Vibrio sp. M260118 TaxID=3020896 RepID=UPI002F3FDC6B
MPSGGSMKGLPKGSMPREKLLSHGPQSLTNAELLAIFLRTGTQGMNVLALSDHLIKEFGSLRKLFAADLDQFCLHKGLGVSGVLKDKQREEFFVLFLDNQHRVISGEPLFQGTIDSASVYPREVVKRALEHNSAALILAHNHPSGVAEPSQSDRRITRRISDALALVDIRVLDHFVVGDGEIVSFAERGWI